MTLSFIVSIAIGFVPLNSEMSFQRTFAYWPFFLIGYYLKQDNFIETIRNFNHSAAWVLLSATLICVYCFMPVMYCNRSYIEIPYDMLVRCLQLFIACILCFSILVVCKDRIPFITELGKYTLLIYLLHPPMVKIMKMICIKAGYSPNFPIAIAITVLTITVIYTFRNLHVFKYLR